MTEDFAPSLAHVLASEGGSQAGSGVVCGDSFLPHKRRKPLVANTNSGSEVFEHKPLATVLHDYIVRPSSGLLGWGGPSAVSRLVIPMHVNAVERRSGRPFPHISKEGRKVGGPLFAHRNSAAAIIRKLGVFRIKAAAFSVVPSAKFRRSPVTRRMAVREAFLRRHLDAQATATPYVSAPNVFRSQANLSAAIASKNPSRATSGHASVAPERNEPTVPLARNIQRRNHPNSMPSLVVQRKENRRGQ